MLRIIGTDRGIVISSSIPIILKKAIPNSQESERTDVTM
jgi:hypothetical protein